MNRFSQVSSRVAGEVMGGGMAALAVLRRGRPLHPDGVVRRGRLTVAAFPVAGSAAGSAAAPDASTGVPLLDDPATHDCLVRVSKAIGLPAGWPDIQGLALRVLDDAGATRGEVLFAGTGTGPVSRHLLAPRRKAGSCSTLLPLQSPSGPLLLLLAPTGEDAWDLSVSRPGGEWLRCGELVLLERLNDPGERFDPVRNPLPGLAHYPVWAAIRAPSYRNARAAGGSAEQ